MGGIQPLTIKHATTKDLESRKGHVRELFRRSGGHFIRVRTPARRAANIRNITYCNGKFSIAAPVLQQR
jgi:hypothetical protein